MSPQPLGIINERYQLLEKLGEGGMAIVYRARELKSGKALAVKVMKTTLTGSSEKRFAREFRAIAGIDHPHCIKVYEFGETAEFPFFTMELFSGRPLTALAGCELPAVMEAIRQAADALGSVHSRKIIHRDVKPSNLLSMLDGDDRPVVKLTDFGLARYYGIPSSISIESGFVGTLAYAAPEQISNAAFDHRVDLYSLGLVCYEVLTGRYPFQSARDAGVQKLMRAQLAEHPPRLRELKAAIPPDLEDVVLAYLEKDPSRRPRSAASLLKVVAAHLGREADDASSRTTVFLSAAERIRSVVGRGRELSSLDQLLRESLSPTVMTQTEWTQSPTPSVAFIMGEAGIGKSHLMREVHRTARRQGAAVYEGRCFKGNLAPYHPFVDILRQMLVGLQQDDSSAVASLPAAISDGMETAALPASVAGAPMLKSDRKTFQGLVDYYSAELLRIAPDLRQWLPGDPFRQVDLIREMNYVMRAVASFFVEVGTQHGACLFIEDLQWADLSTLDLLRHLSSALFRNRERSVESNHSSPRLFVCCTVRSGEAGADSFPLELQRERYGRIIQLSPLSQDECRELICLQLGAGVERASPELVKQLHDQCQGNPYFISESVFTWRDAGRIVCADDTWRLDDSTGGSAWPDSVRDVLRARLEPLSAAAKRTLGACAVIGSVIDTELLRKVLQDMEEADFLDGVDELLARQIVLEKSRSNALEFSHDLLRELAYEQLSGNRRRTLHAHAGEALEAGGAAKTSPELLAAHFYEARVVDRAFRYLLAAAAAALGTYAVDDAQRHLKRAAELEQEIDRVEDKMRLHEMTATAYGAAGKPLKAIECHRQQLALSDGPLTTGRILEEIGRLHFRVGDFDAAVEVFDDALSQIGGRRPRSAFGALTSSGWSLLRHSLPRWLRLPHRFIAQRRRQRMRIAHGVFSTLELLWAQRDVLQCGQAHGRHMVLADQIGELPFLVHAFARRALIFGIFSLNRLALRAGRRALAYARQAGDSEGEAVAKGHVGCAHYFGGRLEEAERLLRDAVTVLDRRGDTWERMYFYHNLRHLYSITGDTEGEIESAKVEMQIGEAVRDPEGTCWGAYGIANALARSGRLDEAHQYMQRALGILAGRTNIVVTPTALQTYGFVHLQSGDYEAAREVLEQSCRDISRHWAFVDYTVRAYPLYAESLLGPNWDAAAGGPDGDDARRSWKVARRAKFWAWRFPNYMPHALRVRGRAAWAVGKRDQAVQCLRQAIKIGDRIGARYDVARACIDLSRLPADDSRGHFRRGRDLLEELGAALPAGELA